MSLLLTSLFSYFLFLLLLLSVNDYPNSNGIKYIIMATLPSYLFGTLLLSRTSNRRSFFSDVIVYSFFFYFYGRVYHLSNPMLLNSTYILYLLRAAIISLNKFSFALEQLTITMDGGLNEIICMNLIRLIKRQNESELLEMLNT